MLRCGVPKLPCGRVFLDAQVKVSEAWLSTEACFIDSVPHHGTGGSPWMIYTVHMAKRSLYKGIDEDEQI